MSASNEWLTLTNSSGAGINYIVYKNCNDGGGWVAHTGCNSLANGASVGNCGIFGCSASGSSDWRVDIYLSGCGGGVSCVMGPYTLSDNECKVVNFTGSCTPPTFYFKKCWTNNRTDGKCETFALQHPTEGRSLGELVCPGQTKCITISTTNKVGWTVVTSLPGASLVFEIDESDPAALHPAWDEADDLQSEVISSSDSDWSTTTPPATSDTSTHTTAATAVTQPATTNIVWTVNTNTATEGSIRSGAEATVEAIRQAAKGAGQNATELHSLLSTVGGDLNSGFSVANGHLSNIKGLLDSISTNGIPGEGGGGETGIVSAVRAFHTDATNFLRFPTTQAEAEAEAEVSIGNGLAAGGVSDIEGVLTGRVTTASISSSIPADRASAFVLPAFRGMVLNFNPLSDSDIASLAGWTRQLFNWGIVLGLSIWILMRSKETIDSMGGWVQASGPMVQGNVLGTGGGTNLASALVARVAIVAALALIPAWLLGWFSSQTSIFSILGVNPLSSSVGFVLNGIWLMDQFVPVLTVVSEPLIALGFLIGLTSVSYGKQVLVRSVPGS